MLEPGGAEQQQDTSCIQHSSFISWPSHGVTTRAEPKQNHSRTRPTSSSGVPSGSGELHFTPSTHQSDQQPTWQTHTHARARNHC